MFNLNHYKLIMVCLIALLTSSCASILLPNRSAIDLNKSKVNEAESMMSRVGQQDNKSKNHDVIRLEQGAWIFGNPVKLDSSSKLPLFFYEEIVFNREIFSLNDFTNRLSELTKVSVSIEAAAARVALDAIAQNSAVTQAAGATPQAAGAARKMRIHYAGTLKGLLDATAPRLGFYWEFEEGTVRFYSTKVRTFYLRAASADTAMSSSVSSAASGSGGGTSSSTSQTIATNAKLAVWDETEKVIKSMLSPSGAVTLSMATGSITVRDIPNNLERVDQYINSVNTQLSKQIGMEVNVYVINLASTDNYGLNWDAIFSGRLNLTLAPVGGSISNGLFRLSSGTSSSAVFQALSTAGKTRRATTASVVAINNQPVPIQVGTQTAYISGSTTTFSGTNAVPVTTMTVSNLSTGFNMTLLPRLVEADEILLQFSIDMSVLKTIRSFVTSTSKVEMPEVDTRNFMQRVSLRSGETLIVSGFEQMYDTVAGSGVFSTENPLFGLKSDQRSRDVLVITIKPTLQTTRQ